MSHKGWACVLAMLVAASLLLSGCDPQGTPVRDETQMPPQTTIPPTMGESDLISPSATSTETAVGEPTSILPYTSPTPSLTPLPSPTPLGTPLGDQTLTATSQPPLSGPPDAAQMPIPGDTKPLAGSFDVYLGAPGPDGGQLLRWVDSKTGQKATEILIRAEGTEAVRAGQYVYFHAPNNRHPRRVNTAGAVEGLPFANPASSASLYQLLPSPTGYFLAWLAVSADGLSYTIGASSWDGQGAREVVQGTLEPGMTARLIRVSNDGQKIFFDLVPGELTDQALFNGWYDLHMLDVSRGWVIQLPGEPACGDMRICDAHVSLDGAFLVRTLPPDSAGSPVVVMNLVSGVVVARFGPQDIPRGAAFELGYPFFTPGGELIFLEAYGPPGLENYLLVWANLVTGEQRLVADLGSEQYRPLGWADDGITLFATREPDAYDTWQINVETGKKRQIAGMLFLGHIEQP